MKVLTAFQDKDSREKFEKLVKEAREDGRLPNELLMEASTSKPEEASSSETESRDDVEIDIKEGTEADGLHQYQQALPFRTIVL